MILMQSKSMPNSADIAVENNSVKKNEQVPFGGITGFYRILFGFIRYDQVLLGFTGFYWVLLGFTRFYCV